MNIISPPAFARHRGGAAILTMFGGAVMGVVLASPAQALPSFARQTGQECAACHNGFPELTPYGRLFKLNGYSFPGGGNLPASNSNLPPISAMVISSFTHTAAPQPGGAGPSLGPNDNFALEVASLFYGGNIAPHLGAFAQVTYDNVAKDLHWDNVDVRYANTTSLLGAETVFGVAFNNNPTVTDVWNTAPAWSYPFQVSGLAPGPNAGTEIEGGLGQQVIGLNAYALWDRLIYTEFGLYRTLSKRAETTLGVSSTGDTLKGVAPYWRVAIEPKWEHNSWEVGTFGLATNIEPGRVTGSGTDHITDIGFDTQYQFLGERDSFSVQATWINENHNLTSSSLLNGTNSLDHLRSMKVKGSYYYEQTYGATVQYFRTQGSGDLNLYGERGTPSAISGSANSSPNSDGWMFELNYIPFNHGGPSFWPWLNVRFGLQYTLYNRFNGGTVNYDGNGRNAGDNNTLYLYSWFAF